MFYREFVMSQEAKKQFKREKLMALRKEFPKSPR